MAQHQDFDSEVAKTKEYVTERFQWLGQQLAASISALNTVQIRMKDADRNYLAAEQDTRTDPWGRGGWNPCEPQTEEAGSLVYSAFKTFSAEDLGISVSVRGDVNADGKFDSADVILLQKWLLTVPNTVLKKTSAADFDENGILTAADLSCMKQQLQK